MSARLALAACLAATALAAAAAQPYTDPTLLDVPWGRYSFVKPAWRGYLETVPAVDYLQGLGVVWNRAPPALSESVVAERLAAAGFARVRLEIPWGSVGWDESGLVAADAARTARVLRALKEHGLRPLILLNANHLQPCPVQWRELTVLADAPAGSLELEARGDLTGADRYTATVMSLADGVEPGPLLERASLDGGSRLRLSRASPRAVRAGERLRVALLKYPPLHAVGSEEFERTAAGWLRYVALVSELVAEHYGSDEVDYEIWNELTFGSAFLDAARYGVRVGDRPDLLQPGGRAHELARRTVQALALRSPQSRVLWGFSNTTFFHVKVPDLPAGIDGQSYHPYGTGRRCFADLHRGKEALLLDGVVPPGCAVQPEGYAHSWQQTESLVRLIAPAARAARPPGSTEFRHYITEHGIAPRELGIVDARAAQRAKTKFLLRAPLLWLGKGITGLYVFSAFDGDESGFGLLGERGEATPALAALQRLTRRLGDAVPVAAAQPLTLAVERDPAAPPALIAGAPQRDFVAVVPLQLDARRFALAAYVMTQDFPRDLPEQPYFIDVTGLFEPRAAVTFYSPETDTVAPVEIVSRGANGLRVRVGLTDVPRLIEIEQELSER